MKFLCDEMLGHLAKALRMAGYDTECALPGQKDKDILRQARNEGRILLTSDQHFCNEEGVVYHPQDSLENWAKILKIDWLLDPFSRCLECNTLLVEATTIDIEEQVPDEFLKEQPFTFCPICKKVFWHGTHTVSMYKQLIDLRKCS